MPIIELDEITRIYRTSAVAVEALKGIDLAVKEREFVAIMGPSGSGKSTLMNILGCLDKPTSGSYRLDGEDVSRFSRGRLARTRNQALGFVFQSFHLLPRTSALENVELPLLYREEGLSWKEIHRRATEALESVGLADRLDHTPNQLSGGQKQRVAVARALVTRPRVLLADEPTGNLDTRTSLEIMDIVQRLNDDGLTILMVTHESEVARFAERVVTLRDGLIESDERTESLSARRELEQWLARAEAEDDERARKAAKVQEPAEVQDPPEAEEVAV